VLLPPFFSLSLTCIVTGRPSTTTSLVRKSAPMVALYWALNFLDTYWFIKDVLPTLEVGGCAGSERRGGERANEKAPLVFFLTPSPSLYSHPLSPRMMTLSRERRRVDMVVCGWAGVVQ